VSRGAQDVVIPADLLDRTWAYLHGDAGADTTAHLDPGGHGLSLATVTALRDWLAGRIGA
jgi:phospholipase/carboxylesterase